MKLDEQMRYSRLLEIYGGMLNQNQQSIMRSYVDYNATLEEIAEGAGITRQAVSDVLRRTRARLDEFEAGLGIFEKYQKMRARTERFVSGLELEQSMKEVITKEFYRILKTLED